MILSEMSIKGSTVRIHDDFMPKTKEEHESSTKRVAEIVGAAEMRIACFVMEKTKGEKRAV